MDERTRLSDVDEGHGGEWMKTAALCGAILIAVLAVFVGGVSLLLLSRPDETHRRVHVALDVFQREQGRLEEIRDWLSAEPEVRGLGEITESSVVVTVLDPQRGRNVLWTPRRDVNAESPQVPAVISDPRTFLDGLDVARTTLNRINAYDCMQNPKQYDNGAVGRFGVRMFPRGPGIPSVFLMWIPEDMFVDGEFVERLPSGTEDWSRKHPRTRYSLSELSDGWHIMLEWD
jgi:hypothetical protein